MIYGSRFLIFGHINSLCSFNSALKNKFRFSFLDLCCHVLWKKEQTRSK